MSESGTAVREKATFESWLAILGLICLPAAVFVAVAGATPSIRQRALFTAGSASLLVVISLTAAVARGRGSGARWPLSIASLLFAVSTFGLTLWAAIAVWTSAATSSIGQTPGVPVVEILALAVGAVLLVTGIKRIEITGFWKSVLSLMDVGLVAAGAVLLGWLGVVVVVAVNLIALVITSVRLAIRKQSILTYAAIQADVDRTEMEKLYDELRQERALKSIDPIKVAELISTLSQRARKPAEIRVMALPIAMLYVVHEPDLLVFASKFDQLMRLHRKRAEEAMSVADQLTVATRESAATFDEMVDALIAAAHPVGPEGQD